MTTPGPEYIDVADLGDLRLEVYRNQRDQWLRARHRHWMEGKAAPPGTTRTGLPEGVFADVPGDLFMAEGATVVSQLISSPHRIVSALVSAARLEGHRGVLDRLPSGTPVFVVDRDAIDGLAGFEIHRGLLVCGQRVDAGGWAELARSSGVCVVLEDLANHDNVGGVFRSVRALAAPRAGSEHPACVLLTARCCDPLYRKALRVSMGNALHVPFAEIEPWPDALGHLVEAGVVPIALDPAADGVEVADLASEFAPAADGRRPALIVGTEGPGVRGETLEAVRRVGGCVARIGIDAGADSLNVGVAAAIALRELGGRRRA